MRYVEIPLGENSPDNADRIVITKIRDGHFQADGVVATPRGVAFFAPGAFASEAEALETALEWASEAGAEMIFVERR